ncbi:MAG TPA: UvrB/UvrC motif-containing protein [Candidatus Angelobacter sp.]|nr:UvrB/UvrC motif-containing protein [Candidatus Angelobacter sp.]
MLSHSIPFSPDQPAEFFTQFPSAPAVFMLRGADPAAEPYVSKTANLRRRLLRLLSPAESQSKRLNLRERVATIEYSLTGSDFESTLLLYRLFRQEFPRTYQKRLRLHAPALIRFNLENAYPRAYVTNKLGRLSARSIYYGPFRSRAVAEKFMNDSLDLFKIRRCTFELHPDPAYPGCVYSEMKMCLAPCFKGCTDEAYFAEVERVQAYFDSRGDSLLGELEKERDRLSAEMEFEAAAQVHTKVAKIKGILSACDEICGRLDQLDGVIVQPSAQPASVALFRFRHGAFTGPEQFPVEAESESVDSRLRAALQQMPDAHARSATQFSEELAILKRWYYRTHKNGEIVTAGENGELSVRKVANAMMRVFRGEKLPAKVTQPEVNPAPAEQNGPAEDKPLL